MAFRLFVLLLLFASAAAKVNLYISREEMNRTLGIGAVLRYVEDGAVNSYAVSYPVLVPANVSSLGFLWWSSAGYPVAYSAAVVVAEERRDAVQTSLSVPLEGSVPTALSPLRMEIRCTGSLAGEIPVRLELSYAWPSASKPTRLSLLRRKICKHRKRSSLPDRLAQPPAPLVPLASPAFPSRAVHVFYVAMGCVVGFVVVVASLIVAYFVRLKRPLGSQRAHTPSTAHMVASPAYAAQCQPFLTPVRPRSPSELSKTSSSIYAKPQSLAHSAVSAAPLPPPPAVSPQPIPFRPPVDVRAALSELRIDLQRLQITDLVQEGTFGEILSGLLVSREAGQPPSPVMIKTVKRGASLQQRQDFLLEGLRFHGVPGHPNVSRVIASGVLVEGEEEDEALEAPLLCYSLSGFLNLKRFLLGSRQGGEAVCSQTLRTQDIVYLALQMLRGLEHLHLHGILHKDLAARNCLISGQLQLVVADTGLGRDLFPDDYHCLGDNENRPVGWLALEALEGRRFSSATEVWAFGVAVWEVLSGGLSPYSLPAVDPEELATSLAQGLRLAQPYNCPDELYGVLFCCWGHHPSSRPTLHQLSFALQDFYDQLTEYI